MMWVCARCTLAGTAWARFRSIPLTVLILARLMAESKRRQDLIKRYKVRFMTQEYIGLTYKNPWQITTDLGVTGRAGPRADGPPSVCVDAATFWICVCVAQSSWAKTTLSRRPNHPSHPPRAGSMYPPIRIEPDFWGVLFWTIFLRGQCPYQAPRQLLGGSAWEVVFSPPTPRVSPDKTQPQNSQGQFTLTKAEGLGASKRPRILWILCRCHRENPAYLRLN